MSLLLAESSLATAGIFKVRGLYYLFDVRRRGIAFLSIQFSSAIIVDSRNEVWFPRVFRLFRRKNNDHVSFLQWNAMDASRQVRLQFFISIVASHTLTYDSEFVFDATFSLIDIIGLILLFLSWFMIHRRANSAYTRLSGITVRKSRKVRRDLRAVYP